MELLSEDDLNLKDMTLEELNRAWDLWFTLAQATNDSDLVMIQRNLYHRALAGGRHEQVVPEVNLTELP